MAILQPVLVVSIDTTLNILRRPMRTLPVLPCLVRRPKRACRPPYRPPPQRLAHSPFLVSGRWTQTHVRRDGSPHSWARAARMAAGTHHPVLRSYGVDAGGKRRCVHGGGQRKWIRRGGEPVQLRILGVFS
ncbi:hypothetical protein VPH35_012057 [Triticum aestivum]